MSPAADSDNQCKQATSRSFHSVKRSASTIRENTSKRVASKRVAPLTRRGAAAKSIPSNIKGVFCGSGSDAMFDPRMCKTILELVDKPTEEIHVVYLGTATYDISQFRTRQTQRFVEAGCQVHPLKVVDQIPENMHELIDEADIIVVGGGNTLFALDRWHRLGLIPTIRRAMERGCVLTGGSAGAICWFDGGHSNAADPDTFKQFRMEKFGRDSSINVVDEIYATSSDEIKDWKYIRVSAMGFLPGLVTPHHDRVQSNGVLRAYDFDDMLLENPGERGIGIDHWAALVVDGPNYRVVSLEDKEGTLSDDGEFVDDGSGVPGVWIKEAVDGKVVARVCPPEGKLTDILRVATNIQEDHQAARRCRLGNPDDGPVPSFLLKQ
jgi:dipeptidase E